MNKRIKYSMIFIILSVLMIQVAGFVSAETYDNYDNATAFLDNITNLQDNSVVTIDSSNATFSGIKEINASNIIIKANGAVTFTVNDTNSYFQITGTNVTIEGITFVGNASYSGSGIYWNGTNGCIRYCDFINNTGEGGAIYWDADNGIVSHCNFISNVGNELYSGAICFVGCNNVVVEYCNFRNNTLSKEKETFGGAICFVGCNNVLINCCNFTNNSAGYGGAIYGDLSNNSVISNCIFIDNSAEIGGAISSATKHRQYLADVTSYNITIINCDFVNNTASYGGAIALDDIENFDIISCDFTNNAAKRTGGAILSSYSYYGNISYCNFNNNNVTFSESEQSIGGAISFTYSSSIGVSHCNFTNNSAYVGGAIRFYGEELAVTYCNFDSNWAYDGGAINIVSNSKLKKAYSSISSTIMDYFVNNCVIDHCNFTNNSATNGGAIGWKTNDFGGCIKYCNFDNNKAMKAGAIVMSGSFQGHIEHCNFTNNSAAHTGAVALSSSYFSSISDCKFINNTASFNGAAVAFSNCYDCKIIGSTFADNNASGYEGYESGDGGAIYLYSCSDCNIRYCDFTNNSAFYDGGAILSVYGDDCYVEYCNFANNSAYGGGAIYFYEDNFIIEHCTFDGNMAYYGGAISSGTINGARFDVNQEHLKKEKAYEVIDTKDQLAVSELKAAQQIPALKPGIIEDATGREIDVIEDTKILYCNFINNKAVIGGAVLLQSSNSNIEYCTFMDNTANICGAVALSGDHCVVNKCNFTNNKANITAGAMGLIDSDNCKVKSCNFIDNSAVYNNDGSFKYYGGSYGGAIMLWNTFAYDYYNDYAYDIAKNPIAYYGDNEISNCNFNNNVADYGGSIANAALGTTIENCNFTDGYANYGSAIYLLSYYEYYYKDSDSRDFDVIVPSYEMKTYEMKSLSLENTYVQAREVASNYEQILVPYEAFISSAFTTLINNNFVNCIAADGRGANVYNDNSAFLNITGGNGAIVYNNGTSAFLLSPVVIYVLNNETKDVLNGDKVTLKAIITTGSKTNLIVSSDFDFIVDGEIINGRLNGTSYFGYYTVDGELGDEIAVSGISDVNAIDVEYKNGILHVRNTTSLDINVGEATYGEDLGVSVHVNPNATGNITLFVDGVEFSTVNVNNGVAKFTIPNLNAGKHIIEAVYNGDDKYRSVKGSTSANVGKADPTLIVVADDISYGENLTINIATTANLTGYITIIVNGEKYNVTANTTRFILPAILNPGNYTILAIYNGDGNYNTASNSTNITVTPVTPTGYNLTANNVVKEYENATQYHAVLTDNFGNPIANKTITVTISSSKWLSDAKYSITTDKDGIATLRINLFPGEYSITAGYDNESVTNDITVLAANFNLKAEDIVKYFKNGTKYSVKVTDENGNPAANKTVYIFVNKDTWKSPAKYIVTTDENGIARLDINLIAGTYTITAKVCYNSTKSNIKVLPILTANNIVKKLSQSATLKAKLVDGQGNPAAGKTVTLTVGVKTYTLTTDSNGIAALPINLDVGTWSFLISNPDTGASTRATVKVTK